MKIAIITRGFSTTWGGAEMVSTVLANSLIEKDFEVSVFAERIDEKEKDKLKEVEFVEIARDKSLFRTLSFNKRVKEEIEKRNFDYIFSLCPYPGSDLFRVSGGVLKTWMKVQTSCPFTRKMKYLLSLSRLADYMVEKKCFKEKNTGHIITNSNLVKNQIVKEFSYDADKISVVYNGVDFNIYNDQAKEKGRKLKEELGIDKDEMVFLYASNNWKRKGLITTIKSIEKVAGTLLIAGRGNKEKYMPLVNKLGLSDRVKFLGVREDMASFYGAGDVFILPTMYDPSANVCFEAMACSVPVITTKMNGAGEIIEEDVDGHLLENSEEVFALQKLLEDLDNRDKLEYMGKKAKEKIQNYSWDKAVSNMIDIIIEDKSGEKESQKKSA